MTLHRDIGTHKECPGRSEGLEIMWFVEPNHEHRETDDQGECDVDPTEIEINV